MKQKTIEIIGYVLNKYHIDLSVHDEKHIEKVVSNWFHTLHLQSPKQLVEHFEKNEEFIVQFYQSFQNGYSTFFREPVLYHVWQVFLYNKYHQLHDPPTLRIWSIGCSSGQEPYSLAMSIEQTNIDYSMNLKYQIFATDINDHALNKGIQGIYSKEELSNITFKQLKQYFTPLGNQKYRIIDSVRKNVHFSKHDIVQDDTKYPKESIYGDFDLIMISNVLIYYNEDVQKDILYRVSESLSSKGTLFTSCSELQFIERYFKCDNLKTSVPIILLQERI